MSPEIEAADFLSLTRKQRIAKCREMATEAERLATGKRAEIRASYLGLKEKWSELADEMERLGGA